jgi:hypothetical protein
MASHAIAPGPEASLHSGAALRQPSQRHGLGTIGWTELARPVMRALIAAHAPSTNRAFDIAFALTHKITGKAKEIPRARCRGPTRRRKSPTPRPTALKTWGFWGEKSTRCTTACDRKRLIFK